MLAVDHDLLVLEGFIGPFGFGIAVGSLLLEPLVRQGPSTSNTTMSGFEGEKRTLRSFPLSCDVVVVNELFERECH